MHLSIFGVAPLIVVRLIDRLSQDRDAFTHEEQLEILARLERIEAALATREAPPVGQAALPRAGSTEARTPGLETPLR